jgi:hypothetical protein
MAQQNIVGKANSLDFGDVVPGGRKLGSGAAPIGKTPTVKAALSPIFSGSAPGPHPSRRYPARVDVMPPKRVSLAT